MNGTDCSPDNGSNDISTDDDTVLPVLETVDEQERYVRVRDYQLEVLRKALKQNVSAFLSSMKIAAANYALCSRASPPFPSFHEPWPSSRP